MTTITTNRRCLCIALIVALGMMFGNQASAQLFSGAGIKGFEQEPKAADIAANPLKNMFSRDRMELPERKPLTFPKLGLFKNSAPSFELGSSDNVRPRLFDGLPRLFPERSAERPSFLNDLSNLNDRTKSMFAKPAFSLPDWAARKNGSAKSKTFETWDAITQGFKNPLGRNKAAKPTQPPLRSAQRPTDTPPVRF